MRNHTDSITQTTRSSIYTITAPLVFPDDFLTTDKISYCTQISDKNFSIHCFTSEDSDFSYSERFLQMVYHEDLDKAKDFFNGAHGSAKEKNFRCRMSAANKTGYIWVKTSLHTRKLDSLFFHRLLITDITDQLKTA